MNISIDYDSTYTRDPEAWDLFISNFVQRGHNVYCVTMRYDNPIEADPVRLALADKVTAIYFTGRAAKQNFMNRLGIPIHVWIDDSPNFILNDARS